MHSPTVERLRDRDELSARRWLLICSIPIWLVLLGVFMFSMAHGAVSTLVMAVVYSALFFLFKRLGELFAAAHFKTNAIRVSPTQLPGVYATVQAVCAELGIEEPEVYVMQQNLWNSFAMKLAGRSVVVLLSGTLDSLLLKGDAQQVTWLVGHEIGHHAAGHLDWELKLIKLGGWLPFLLLWHSRRAELTCDRVGLHCAKSLRAAQLAVSNLTVGAQLAGQVNSVAAAEQWDLHRGEFIVRLTTLFTTHPHHLCRMVELDRSARELSIAA